MNISFSTCSKCGVVQNQGFQVCTYCGYNGAANPLLPQTNITANTAAFSNCGKCGVVQNAGSQVCTYCGAQGQIQGQLMPLSPNDTQGFCNMCTIL